MIPVFDSNIIIDIGKGYPQAHKEFSRYPKVAISIITWIEVMSGNMKTEEERATESFLSHLELLPLDATLAPKVSRLRRQYRLKLPDAVIWAAAQSRNTLLVTRNSQDFPQHDPSIRIPYVL